MRQFALATTVLLALAPCTATAQTPWGGGIGVGWSTVGHPSGFPEDEALRAQGSVPTFTAALRRQVAGPLRVGLRASYLRIETSAAYYCRLTCVVVANASQIHMIPLTPTLEAEWKVQGGQLFMGAGFGPSVLIRAVQPDPTARLEPDTTDVRTAVVLFAGFRPAAARARFRLEFGWRRLPDVAVWSDVHRTPISGFEFAVHLAAGM